jgi:subtilisin family serine protease
VRRVRWILAAALAALLPGCASSTQPGWALEATQLDALRHRADGSGVRVAVLDTGIDTSLPALRHLVNGDASDGELVAYRDFLGRDDGPRDGDGHGSHVAGILAGRPPSGMTAVLHQDQGLEGLAPGIELMVGRLCDDGGHCSFFGLRQALQWAMAGGADIVSLSLGFSRSMAQGAGEYVGQVRALLGQMEAEGTLVVAAAGNTGALGVLFPADDPNVVAVGAVGRDLQPRATTAFGPFPKPDLSAPGESIVGPSDRGLEPVDGTSAAVPFVVAAAALLMQAGGEPSDGEGVERLRAALESTAMPLPGQARPRDPRSGLGLLQADDAWRAYAGCSREPWACGPGMR